jgi:ribonuclease HII
MPYTLLMSKLPQKKRLSATLGTIGIDEVGRGPLAGPVTVCACYIEDPNRVLSDLFGGRIRDSKIINKSLRNNIYQTIRHKRYLNTRVEYAIASRSAAYIDKHGISQAIRHCLLSCMQGLEAKGLDIQGLSIKLDAGLRVPLENLSQESFIKGDERYVEIALASIIAKESRDSYMKALAKKHKEYGWENNAGYGTQHHRESIKIIGITKHHRKTYLKAFKLFDKAE